MAQTEADKDVLQVHSTKCLRCAHLVEGAEKKFNRCHFTRGNSRCPAQSVAILISGDGIEFNSLVSDLSDALRGGNAADINTQMSRLTSRPRLAALVVDKARKRIMPEGKAQ